jgi:ribosomal protein S18 acetylase RimI-like enzyme
MPTGARLARTTDTPEIAAIQIRSWRATFADVLPGDILDNLDVGDIGATWASSILLPPTTRHRLLVAIDGSTGSDVVVGYAALGPSADPDLAADPNTGELLALVIDPGHTRVGHGSRLMSAAVDYLRADGMTHATTWAQAADEIRRAFLLAAGWGPDSAFRDIQAGDATVREVRLVTDLTGEGENENPPV